MLVYTNKLNKLLIWIESFYPLHRSLYAAFVIIWIKSFYPLHRSLYAVFVIIFKLISICRYRVRQQVYTTRNTVRCMGMSHIKDGGHYPEVDRILRLSQLVYVIATKFQRLHPYFRGQTTDLDYWEYCPMSGYDVNQRWRPLIGNR